MKEISFDYSNVVGTFLSEEELKQMQAQVAVAHQELREGTGVGSDFLGWLDWPQNYDKEEFACIQAAAKKIQNDSDVLIVIGIGGSYLGAKAAIDFLAHSFYNDLPENVRKTPKIYFAGNHMSSVYLAELIDLIKDQDISLNVISKSGTTTEPAIAFRLLRQLMIDKYGEGEANRRIYATTDRQKGALKSTADEKGYETFVIPDDIGGRFSVLTAVGLLPIAVAGGDIVELMQGAAFAMDRYLNVNIEENEAYQYAALRNILYRKGYQVENIVNYEPKLNYFSEWWKQLYGESEGKNQKGIFPAQANFTTDLHSVGQYIQEGRRFLFQTVLHIQESGSSLSIPIEAEDIDGLGYIEGTNVEEVNHKAFQGVLLAHTDGGVPNFVISLPDTSAFTLGQLFYFFEVAVGISGYLNGVNPFNQPGVEAYKQNMFALLGKPGFEALAQKLNQRLNK
ncbi:glucose-6-phosphate isomerase [Allofustis seminis]|uniref:glucose-6-phosphate isomerase n=1 Tax=Allofustis seminis TaxID=166939 RepID=UPI0003669D26|nr:glucose-6-phosphate isomerase [Allofustis seminis]